MYCKSIKPIKKSTQKKRQLGVDFLTVPTFPDIKLRGLASFARVPMSTCAFRESNAEVGDDDTSPNVRGNLN